MKHILFLIVTISLTTIFFINLNGPAPEKEPRPTEIENPLLTITGMIQPGETMEKIFNKHNLSIRELSEIVHASREQHNLSMLSVGNTYHLQLDTNMRVQNMQYVIDDLSFLSVTRRAEGLRVEKREIQYEKRPGSLYIQIKNNLVSSMPSDDRDYLKVALQLSDIYAWDIDFLSDIRNGDSVKILLEEIWFANAFKGYGDILAAEFVTNGRTLKAYRYHHKEYAGYYDEEGKSLRKTLLRSPLKYRRISSYFTERRYHPILRVYRPHLAIDYAAPAGTPVSAAGDGTVTFAGYKGQAGKLVKIKHPGGFETFYGHLARIPNQIKRGSVISQGAVVGYVGSTGLATGPHLDYRMKFRGDFVDPLKVKLPRGEKIPDSMLSEFRRLTNGIDLMLASLTRSEAPHSENQTATRM